MVGRAGGAGAAGVVTVTSTVPAAGRGGGRDLVVELTTVTLVAASAPKSTAVAPVKLVPVMVTMVPPAAGPAVGADRGHGRGGGRVGELVGRRRWRWCRRAW